MIIVLGTDVHGGEKVFYGMTIDYIGKRSHIIKHSHVRCVVGAFDKNLHEGYIWNGPRDIISFPSTNQYFFTLYIMVQNFMTNIYNLMTERNIFMMMGMVFFQNKKLDSFIIKISEHIF